GGRAGAGGDAPGAPPPVRGRGAAGPRVRRSPAADRRRADDLAAVHRGTDERAPGADRAREGARDRHGERIPGGGARRAGGAGVGTRGGGGGGRGVGGGLGYQRVWVGVASGTWGWPEEAPFDGIIVAAGGPRVPPPLFEQLADGGRMVMPVGEIDGQVLKLVEKVGGEMRTSEHAGCVFVKLVGKYAWEP